MPAASLPDRRKRRDNFTPESLGAALALGALEADSEQVSMDAEVGIQLEVARAGKPYKSPRCAEPGHLPGLARAVLELKAT